MPTEDELRELFPQDTVALLQRLDEIAALIEGGERQQARRLLSPNRWLQGHDLTGVPAALLEKAKEYVGAASNAYAMGADEDAIAHLDQASRTLAGGARERGPSPLASRLLSALRSADQWGIRASAVHDGIPAHAVAECRRAGWVEQVPPVEPTDDPEPVYRLTQSGNALFTDKRLPEP